LLILKAAVPPARRAGKLIAATEIVEHTSFEHQSPGCERALACRIRANSESEF